MSLEEPINTSITDLSSERQRIWTRTNSKNRYGKPVLTDTGWDLVTYDGLGTGVEPGVSNFEQRASGKVSDRRYTGILILDEKDTLVKAATSTGGPIPRASY